MMDQKLKSNLMSSTHWLRFLYMVLFAVFLQIAISVMWVLVIVQFFFALITGSDNASIRRVCGSLSIFIYQIITYLTYNSDEKAFPFSDWPNSECECDCECGAECEVEAEVELETDVGSANNSVEDSIPAELAQEAPEKAVGDMEKQSPDEPDPAEKK